jgi:hypothetical protein
MVQPEATSTNSIVESHVPATGLVIISGIYQAFTRDITLCNCGRHKTLPQNAVIAFDSHEERKPRVALFFPIRSGMFIIEQRRR